MNKYTILLSVLDQLRKEAPVSFSRYYPKETDVEGYNQANSRAFIHLFLKVKFGLLNFIDRENLITDGAYDGGIDAYYISNEEKKVFLVQSKFRSTETNFNSKEISLSELLNMDINRIIKGEENSENGSPYNNKIKQLQRNLNDVGDIGRYDYEVIILANLQLTSDEKLKRLTGGFKATIFDHEKTYNALVFPIIKGTFYNNNELKIAINLTNKNSQDDRITYEVNTQLITCDISVLFVPTIEIAKSLYKYKNSILKYNPRSYLDLTNNTINRDIARTMTNLSTNEFALYNNGITMLSYNTFFSQNVGKKDQAQLIITQPQIINGGQTAYTLSRVYEDNLENDNLEEIFSGKEVLVKIITLPADNINDTDIQLKFIETISKATNQQTQVNEADRRSNDKIQIEMQNAIFNEYGYLYERKRGEYADGIRAGYIQRGQIINREIFIRICKCCNLSPSEARRSSVKQLFEEQNFSKTLNNIDRFKEYFYAYLCYEELNIIEKKFSKEKNNKFGLVNYGYALRYGKFAVITACIIIHKSNTSPVEVKNMVNFILDKWLDFESQATQLKSNSNYFLIYLEDSFSKQVLDYDGYYKGRTLDSNVRKYFSSNTNLL